MKTETKNMLKGLVLGLVLAAAGSALAAWSEPTQAPPGGNAEAPINVSNSAQTKGGNLVLNNNNQFANALILPFGALVVGDSNPTVGLKVDVVGKTGSDQFCNGTGTKCFTVDTLCQKVNQLCP